MLENSNMSGTWIARVPRVSGNSENFMLREYFEISQNFPQILQESLKKKKWNYKLSWDLPTIFRSSAICDVPLAAMNSQPGFNGSSRILFHSLFCSPPYISLCCSSSSSCDGGSCVTRRASFIIRRFLVRLTSSENVGAIILNINQL